MEISVDRADRLSGRQSNKWRCQSPLADPEAVIQASEPLWASSISPGPTGASALVYPTRTILCPTLGFHPCTGPATDEYANRQTIALWAERSSDATRFRAFGRQQRTMSRPDARPDARPGALPDALQRPLVPRQGGRGGAIRVALQAQLLNAAAAGDLEQSCSQCHAARTSAVSFPTESLASPKSIDVLGLWKRAFSTPAKPVLMPRLSTITRSASSTRRTGIP